MTLIDLLYFYLGDAEAIRRLAANPWTPAIGAIFVFSAGLARHYDTHDLWRQSWRLLMPFAASTLAASLLFLVIMPTRGLAGAPAGWAFLAMFWLTAPLAWLYGLPFERLWPAPQAARARRWTLGVVAVLRVALMTRCVSVLLDYDWDDSLMIVGSFAIPMAILAVSAALYFVRKPEASIRASAAHVADMMGVVPDDLRPVQRPLVLGELRPTDTSAVSGALGCLSIILMVVFSLMLAQVLRNRPAVSQPLVTQAVPPSPAVWCVALLTILLWVPLLLLRQPAHRRRTMYVSRLRDGPLTETLDDIATLWPADFPAHWNPAAALAQEHFAPRMLEAIRRVADLPSGSWVRDGFLDQFQRMIPLWLDYLDPLWLENLALGKDQNERMSEAQLHDLARLRDLLRLLPEGGELLQAYQDYLTQLCDHTRERDPPRYELLQELLTLTLRCDSPR